MYIMYNTLYYIVLHYNVIQYIIHYNTLSPLSPLYPLYPIYPIYLFYSDDTYKEVLYSSVKERFGELSIRHSEKWTIQRDLLPVIPYIIDRLIVYSI